MLKRLMCVGSTLMLILALTGCSAIKSVSSEAYALGLATGQQFAATKEMSDNLQSWFPDEGGSESEPTFQDNEDSVRESCRTWWTLTGITSGLENSDANENDFVAGCMDGLGY